MRNSRQRAAETIAAQALHIINEQTGAVVPGIEPSTTFARDTNYEFRSQFSYAREASPTTAAAEAVVNALSEGSGALLFNAGLAAISAVLETIPNGQHVVAPRVMYYGAADWLRRINERRGVDVTFFDQADPNALSRAIRPGKTALVWIETPVNPTWDVIDIASAAKLAHAAGARLGVDATVSPPCTTNAVALGADIVFQSATKYLGGHSDLTAGALVTAKDDEHWREIYEVRKLTGSILPAFEAWLLIRGMRTLFVRFERASANALAIAKHFETHPKVARVLYPGLQNHPSHDVASRQMTNGFGGMLSLLVNGDGDYARRVAGQAQVFMPATSLGGVESLIEHRKSVEGPHSQVPENLLRLSVGIEAVDDLVADLEQALSAT